MQGPIDAILAIMREQNVDARQIVNIEVAVLEAGWNIVCEPMAKKYHPESAVDAQFSMPFGAAVAALDGKAGLDQFTADRARAPQVRGMMGKVTLMKDIRIDGTFPREWPAHVAILLDDGQRYEKFVRYPKGDPENPLTWDEMAAKFRSLAGRVLSPDRCDSIVEQIAASNPVMLNPAKLPGLCANRE
jgi:2-methylcitrate dehydratase PrpD